MLKPSGQRGSNPRPSAWEGGYGRCRGVPATTGLAHRGAKGGDSDSAGPDPRPGASGTIGAADSAALSTGTAARGTRGASRALAGDEVPAEPVERGSFHCEDTRAPRGGRSGPRSRRDERAAGTRDLADTMHAAGQLATCIRDAIVAHAGRLDDMGGGE